MSVSDSEGAQGERTPEEWRDDLLDALLAHAPFEGWTDLALRRAAADCGLEAGFAALVFPGGAIEALDCYLDRLDRRMASELERRGIAGLRTRERIAAAVMTRLELVAPHREAMRRAIGVLALPRHAGLAARSLWRTVDAMWRAAGDQSADWNYYSKRLILSGVWSATLLVWLADDSDDFAETRAFLDRRIADVMRFEKAKAEWRKTADALPSLTRFLGRLRYPSA